MKNKLREYIELETSKYEFSNDYKDLKEELLANSIDRFDELIKDGLTQQQAYVETIKCIGNIDSIFQEEQLKSTKNRVDFSFLFVAALVTFGNIFLLIYFMETEISKFVIITDFFVAILAFIFLIFSIKNTTNRDTWLQKNSRKIIFITYYFFISITFAVSKLILHFNNDNYFFEYISNYILIGIFLGYIFLRLVNAIFNDSIGSLKNNLHNHKQLLFLTFGISIFTMIDYSNSLLVGNKNLIGTMIIAIYLFLIAHSKFNMKSKIQYEKITQAIFDIVMTTYIIVIILSLTNVIEFPLNFPLRVSLVSYIVILFYLIYYIVIKSIKGYKTNISDIVITYLKLIISINIARRLLFYLRNIVTLPSYINVGPHEMRLWLSILIVCLWLLQLMKKINYSKLFSNSKRIFNKEI